VIVRFVDIGGIDDHHCFKLSFRNHEIKSLSFKKIGLKRPHTVTKMDENTNMDSTIAGSMNDNINLDSTIAGLMNDNINMDSTIAGSMNDNINMDSTIAGSMNARS
jgi:hypothetical protein